MVFRCFGIYHEASINYKLIIILLIIRLCALSISTNVLHTICWYLYLLSPYKVS
jgi:hypothetical protein